MSVLDYLLEIHRDANWSALLVFYGAILALGGFGCLAVLHFVRGRKTSKRIAELEAGLRRSIDERAAHVTEKVEVVEAQARQMAREGQTFRERIDQVENRIPSLYDRLDEFQATLAQVFKNELGAVLGSFDSSVSAVLQHMKAELHTGIAQIEGIEDMVRSRRQAERTLLQLPGPSKLSAALSDAQELPEEQAAGPQEDGYVGLDLEESTSELTLDTEGGGAPEEAPEIASSVEVGIGESSTEPRQAVSPEPEEQADAEENVQHHKAA